MVLIIMMDDGGHDNLGVMRMVMLLPSLHPLFSIYNDGGHDDGGDGDDDATFAPSALGNRSSPPQSSPSYSAK